VKPKMEYGKCETYGTKNWFQKIVGILKTKKGFKMFSTLTHPIDWEDT
jgi:hypothetical protein